MGWDMWRVVVLATIGAALAGCSMSSSVMDTGGGTYLVTGQASPLRGGSEQAVHDQATAFCAKQSGRHPVVLGIDQQIMSKCTFVAISSPKAARHRNPLGHRRYREAVKEAEPA
jgi:hypothetical protein